MLWYKTLPWGQHTEKIKTQQKETLVQKQQFFDKVQKQQLVLSIFFLMNWLVLSISTEEFALLINL